MGFGKSDKSEDVGVEPNGHQNYGYIDDEVKFPNLNGGKDGVEDDGKNDKKDKKEPEEEKDKSSIFALVSFLFNIFCDLLRNLLLFFVNIVILVSFRN